MVDGIQTVRIGREEIFNFIAGIWLRRQKWLAADVVIEHLSKVACGLPLFLNDRPFLAHVPHLFREAIFEEVPWPLGVYVYGMESLIPRVYGNSFVWATSRSTADELAALGIQPKNIKVIADGADTAFFGGDRRPTPQPTVLYVGRIRKYKGVVDPLLKAWALVVGQRPEARLRIVGRGDYERILMEEIARNGLAQSVEFIGYVTEERKAELMRAAWFLVYPSVKEGWGLPVIEAGAAGIPAVASDSPGLRDAVQDGKTGLLVAHGDVPALAAAMLRLMNDDALRQRLGTAAREWSGNFDWDVMARQILEHLQHCFPKHGNLR